MHKNVSKTKPLAREQRGDKRMYVTWQLPEDREMLRAIAKRRGQTMSRVTSDLVREAYRKEFGS